MKKQVGIFVLMGVLFIGMTVMNILNMDTMGGADSYMHHMFAKWSFVHPHLFFDQWGKPLFTLLSSPFAQFGIKGSVTFNILISILSGFLVYKIAKEQKLKYAWLGIFMTVFAPKLFMMAFSSMTEVLFGFVLILTVYLWSKNQWLWSVVVLSFIPFARTEGIIFFPIFAVALAYLKEYKLIPFLASGFVLMSLLGYPVYEDLLWPINTMPYGGASGLYGSGELMHFVNYSSDIFGWPLLVAFLFGLITLGGLLRNTYSKNFAVLVFLVLGCSFGYFAAHSVVWAFGLGGSAGLVRVIAGIIPLVALVGLYGINGLLGLFKLQEKWVKLILGVLACLFVIEALTKHRFPVQLGPEEKVMVKAIGYIHDQGLDDSFIIYYNPYEVFLLGLDHFSNEKSRDRVFNNEHPSLGLEPGTLVIWDAHFSPNEGGLSKNVIMNDTGLILIKDFQPQYPFTTYKEAPYEVLLFQKKAE